MSARRLWIIACAVGTALSLAACGQVSQPTSLLNNGVYVDAGPVTYQLEVSRELNPFAAEDRQYLTGLPAGTTHLGANELWYGVFLWAKNQTGNEQPTASRFQIVDSSGNRYDPVQLDSSVNGYAWTQQTLGPSEVEPGPSTTAALGPTQGGLVLFRLPTAVYSNRPLTLEIFAPGGGTGQISLDL